MNPLSNYTLPKAGPINHILLADDDIDDCLFFKDALEELGISTQLTTVHNGEQLMRVLNENEQLPDILFLDLNMPRKNGFDCLAEIKKAESLKHLTVIILSTSFNQTAANQLYNNGAQHYIRKPNEFSQLKNLIHTAITLTVQANLVQPGKDQFVLQNELGYQ
jgi:CheY-like chemotaxis protein